MSEGEILQIQKSRNLKLTQVQYFEIIKKKTATLISACTECGAKSVKADDNSVKLMKEFGVNVGIAFQIKDDLFDYEKRNNTGKPTGNDIKEKKLTLPMIHALENATYSERRRIISIINKHYRNSEKISEVIDFVYNNGGIEYSVSKMNEYKTAALEKISVYPDSPIKSSIEKLVNYTVSRKK